LVFDCRDRADDTSFLWKMGSKLYSFAEKVVGLSARFPTQMATTAFPFWPTSSHSDVQFGDAITKGGPRGVWLVEPTMQTIQEGLLTD
jgi:hypothetical protein